MANLTRKVMNMNEYKIATKGGTMCFYGEWFGRPFDNFHRIIRSGYQDDCFKIYFDQGEVLSVFHPCRITSDAKHFEIIKASKVIWIHIPYGSHGAAKEYIYTSHNDGTVLKTVGSAKAFYPQRKHCCSMLIVQINRNRPVI